ncbi:MAG: 50S ribosome-binding GTPase [Butyrivibrio sp.]|nr:50S ribosome-binding GTPase [Butyrivibrio sp.]
MDEKQFKEELKQCKKSAGTGYRIAYQQAGRLNMTLLSAQDSIQQTIYDFNNSPCYISDATENLGNQLSEISDSFAKLSSSVDRELEKKRKNLSKFSITLFGRTMAGKSTLMEYLTHGNGERIGKGAQRTTLDVRNYKWNGLEITDVPGIGAAIDGQADEDKAFEAAKSADLIMFLLTDDAPQKVEADCLARVKELGKPIICILNVKMALPENKSLKFKLNKIREAFDYDRLNAIKEQFISYDSQYGQTWKYIPFIYVHLNAAFLSQHSPNPDEAQALLKASHIEKLEDKIIEQVSKRGQIYRIKSFIDTVSKPMMESTEKMLHQSHLNSAQGRTIVAKRRSMEKWKNKFDRDSSQEITSLVEYIRTQLNSEVSLFAEEHFDDKNADKAWNGLVKERHFEEKCQKLLNKFENQCNEQIEEISREITNELNFSAFTVNDKSLRMHKIIDGKKAWNWTATILSGGLVVADGIAYLLGAAAAGPLGWLALGVTGVGLLGSFIFKKREKKENEARKKLEKNLRQNVTKICDYLLKQLNKNKESLIEKKITNVIKELDKINAAIFRLADTQKELAWGVNRSLLEINKELLTQAVYLTGASGLEYSIREIARIPGDITLIMVDNENWILPDQKRNIEQLINEHVEYTVYTDDKRTLIANIIRHQVSNVEEKIGVAHVRVKNESPFFQNRVVLAEQLSNILIVKE